HLKKGQEAVALHEFGGTGAFGAVARANYVCYRDKDDHDRRVFLSAGGNIGRHKKGFSYHVESENFQAGEYFFGHCAKIGLDEPLDMTADEWRAKQQEEQRESKADIATAFLSGALANGPQAQDDIEERAEKLGIKPITLRRAREALDVK